MPLLARRTPPIGRAILLLAWRIEGRLRTARKREWYVREIEKKYFWAQMNADKRRWNLGLE
jgi:hypothetical protein